MSITIGGVTYTGTTVINGIECLESVHDLREGIHDGGPAAQKKYVCTWANRYALANSFMGLVTHSGGQNGAVTLQAPMQYPESPNMLAREIEIEGVGQPTQGAKQLQFPHAVVTVNFGVPTWNAIPYPDMSIDPTTPFIYATQDIDFGQQLITVPNSRMLLANGHFLDDVPYNVVLPTATFTIQLHRVPFLPAGAIWNALQKPLNSLTFLGIPAGYLKFDGCKNHAEASSDGTQAQSLTYVFSARAILRWDEVWDKDPTVTLPQKVYNGTTGVPILDRSDLRAVIPAAYYG